MSDSVKQVLLSDNVIFEKGECFGFMEAVSFFGCQGVNKDTLLDACNFCKENILKERGEDK